MVPRALAARAQRRCAPKSPAYLGTLRRWTRERRRRSKGCFSRRCRAAQDYTVGGRRARSLERYAVDGLHLDYIRYPDDRRSTTRRGARAVSRRAAASAPPPSATGSIAPTVDGRDGLDARVPGRLGRLPARSPDDAREPDRHRGARARGRRSRSRPPWSPIAPTRARTGSRTGRGWAAHGLSRRRLPDDLHDRSADVRRRGERRGDRCGATPMWAGIGAYRLPVARTAANVRTARRAGAAGVLLFSYDSLIGDDARRRPATCTTLRPILLDAARRSAALSASAAPFRRRAALTHRRRDPRARFPRPSIDVGTRAGVNLAARRSAR